jgi:putative transposase
MSLYRRFDPEGLPSFVTTNTSERRGIFKAARTCELLVRTVYEVRAELKFHLLAFAIMPDHLHLVVVPPEAGLGRVMQLIKGRFSHTYNAKAGSSGPVWQTRYHERTLKTEAALFRAIEYVHNNRVSAHLVATSEDYQWSTANGRYEFDLQEYLGQAKA